MRYGNMGRLDPYRGHDEEAAALVDVVSTLERDFELEQGTLIRHLTAVLRRRHRFEKLKRDHDVRLQ